MELNKISNQDLLNRLDKLVQTEKNARQIKASKDNAKLHDSAKAKCH